MLALAAAMCWSVAAWPQAASTTGQTGLINMPDARVAPDGTLRFGYSYADPYSTVWTSITFLPRIELSGRVTRFMHVPGFTDTGTDYGDFKDKAIDGKLVLVEEGKWWPQFAIGGQDFIGTRVMPAWYAVASKRLGDFDFTVGYGGDRIDGVFGGVRYRPSALPGWALVAEYDANNYPQDFGAAMSGAANLKQGSPGVGIEYTWGWLTGQVAYTREKAAAMGYISIPLAQKDFIPKYNEPLPYTKITPRPTREQWLESEEPRQRMAKALAEQDFRNIRISYVHDRVEVVLTNSRISLVSRAVGRAARTILLLSPVSAREIRITYTVKELPIVTYSFPDLDRLQRYFNGMLPRWELAQHVDITYAAPGADEEATDVTGMLKSFEEHQPGVKVLYKQEDGDFIQLKSEDLLLNQFRVRPSAAVYLNDPSGAFKYEIGIQASLDHRLARRTFFSVALNYNIFETVSDVTQPSNSLLPHVRSDIAEYKAASRLKLTRLLINQLYQPAERVYARASAGYSQEMFAGAGGQVLYLPAGAGWGADLAVDWVAQRNHEGLGFDFYKYNTVTAIGSFHYRLPMGMTATARAGRFLAKDEGVRFELKRRFLAKDEGVRFELKRRFASGWEVGAWYTRTNGDDITSPGSPGNPYYDKGLFMTIPLNLFLPKDTQATAPMSIAPWTRDVGAMVVSPLDLYRLMEKPLIIDVHDQDGLVMFGDVDDNYHRRPGLGSPVSSPSAKQGD